MIDLHCHLNFNVDDGPVDDDTINELIDAQLADGASTRDAVAAVVAKTGAPKRHVYELANQRAR